MKNCDEQEAVKMEAYLKFYAEYLGCKTNQRTNRSGKKDAGKGQRPSDTTRRKPK